MGSATGSERRHTVSRKASVILMVLIVVAFTIISCSDYSSSTDDSVTTPIVGSARIEVTSSTTEWTNGKTYEVKGDVTISEQITVTGNVSLYLGSGCKLVAEKGIKVSSGNSLTINGEGALTATGVANGAGIGGCYTESTIMVDGKPMTTISNESPSAGTITINGGNITATGGENGAGIGGGKNGSGGSFTINGGAVTARGGENGAGIGGGYCGSGGAVRIDGGEGSSPTCSVTATGGSSGAAGIGHGCEDGKSLSHGEITMLGRLLMAYSTDSGNSYGYYFGFNNTRYQYMKTEILE